MIGGKITDINQGQSGREGRGVRQSSKDNGRDCGDPASNEAEYERLFSRAAGAAFSIFIDMTICFILLLAVNLALAFEHYTILCVLLGFAIAEIMCGMTVIGMYYDVRDSIDGATFTLFCRKLFSIKRGNQT